MVDHIVDATTPRGRVEIRSGVGRRRRWSDEDKGRIVAESYAPGAVVSEVARRHEISPQHLFAWRKAARAGRLTLPTEELACWRGWLSVLLHPRENKSALDRAHQKMRKRLRIWSNSNRYGSATSLFAAMITMSWEKMEALYQLKPPSRTT